MFDSLATKCSAVFASWSLPVCWSLPEQVPKQTAALSVLFLLAENSCWLSLEHRADESGEIKLFHRAGWSWVINNCGIWASRALVWVIVNTSNMLVRETKCPQISKSVNGRRHFWSGQMKQCTEIKQTDPKRRRLRWIRGKGANWWKVWRRAGQLGKHSTRVHSWYTIQLLSNRPEKQS